MRIVIAPDKFKDCLTAPQVAEAIAKGIRAARPDATLDLIPLADGGEGTVDALIRATNGRIERRHVTGPLSEMKVEAPFGVLGDGTTAVVEMSAASGLALLKPQDRNPLNTTTFGTGELLVAASQIPGITHILLGIGGSATCDAGVGCAQACGQTVILEGGEPVSMTEPLCGRDLSSVILIKHGRGSPVERVRITVACDVTNPLFGPNGAAPVFGPQKGASPDEVKELDELLRSLATRLGKLDVANTAGAGAAGGLGFGMLAFFPNTSLRPGFDLVADAVGLRDRLAGAHLCITGEGRLDVSSLSGKTAVSVARICREMNVPCVALVGDTDDAMTDPAAASSTGFRAIYTLRTPGQPLADAIWEAPQRLIAIANRVVDGLA